jgi:hypothetical protein
MAVAPTDRVAVHPSVICRELSGEMVLLDLESGVYYGLDEVGTRAWQLLLEGKSVAEVCGVMSEEYDVAKNVLFEDVARLVADLRDRNIVSPRDAEAR